VLVIRRLHEREHPLQLHGDKFRRARAARVGGGKTDRDRTDRRRGRAGDQARAGVNRETRRKICGIERGCPIRSHDLIAIRGAQDRRISRAAGDDGRRRIDRQRQVRCAGATRIGRGESNC